jgi:hypothetical protein
MELLLEPFTTEILAPGLTREWSADRQLLIYTAKNNQIATLTIWLDSVKYTIQHWEHSSTCFLMHHVTKFGPVQSVQYLQSRLPEIDQAAPPNVKAWVAVVLPGGMLIDIAKLIVMTIPRSRNTRNTIVEIFSSREKALDWLCQQAEALQVEGSANKLKVPVP